jgi:predicted GIY-YIG superfamily endonuclease
MSFWVYMLRCADNSFYIGHTDNLETRIARHACGDCAGYTSSRRPVHLVYSQEFQTRDEALQAERQIKGWSRAKKQALIDGDWKHIQQLAWGKRNPLPDRLS